MGGASHEEDTANETDDKTSSHSKRAGSTLVVAITSDEVLEIFGRSRFGSKTAEATRTIDRCF